MGLVPVTTIKVTRSQVYAARALVSLGRAPAWAHKLAAVDLTIGRRSSPVPTDEHTIPLKQVGWGWGYGKTRWYRKRP